MIPGNGTDGDRTPMDLETYRSAFRETATATLIADERFRIVDVNDACVGLCGYERDELLGEPPTALFNDPNVFDEVIESLAEGNRWQGEFEVETKDGRLVYGRGTAAPLSCGDAVRGYIGSFADLTRHRQYEQSLRVLNRVLRHNLRNDANVILGHLELIGEAVEDEAVDSPALRASLETAIERLETLLGRADTTRAFSGILAEYGESAIHPVRLDAAVRQGIRLASVDEARVSFDDRRPSAYGLADETVTPAIAALVENAIEHNDAPEPRVEIRIEERENAVVLTIADNGPGVDPERRDRIFGREEFTQVHHGQGLSLFFVDRLMEMYGGTARHRDNEPRGSVFELRFRKAEP